MGKGSNRYGLGYARGIEHGKRETEAKLKANHQNTAAKTGLIGFVVGALLTAFFKRK